MSKTALLCAAVALMHCPARALAGPTIARPLSITASADRPSAQIIFDLSACNYIAEAKVAAATVQYTFGPTRGDGRADTTAWESAVTGTVQWANPATSRLRLRIVLPPGFYHYEILAESSGYRFACEEQWYIAALPYKNQTITGEMVGGIEDPVTQLLIAGTLPDGVTADLVRYDGAPACGDSTKRLISHKIWKLTTLTGAYYAYDNALTAKDSRSAVFGLGLAWPNGEHRIVRVTADYPADIISGAPTFTRFDVTAIMAKKLLAQPADFLICAEAE